MAASNTKVMKLFLDDERFPPGEDTSGWVICRTSKQAINHVKKNGWPSFISFDHDLGGDKTAMEFVDWIVLKALNENQPKLPFKFSIHSMNPVGGKNIKDKLERLNTFLIAESFAI